MLFSEETYKINGAMYEVHKHLGCGFLEKVYQEALEKEFQLRDIPYEREKPITIYYKDQPLEQQYIADFLCYGNIIVELKAISELTGAHISQVLNYLKATKLHVGLLVNFGEKSLHIERLTL